MNPGVEWLEPNLQVYDSCWLISVGSIFSSVLERIFFSCFLRFLHLLPWISSLLFQVLLPLLCMFCLWRSFLLIKSATQCWDIICLLCYINIFPQTLHQIFLGKSHQPRTSQSFSHSFRLGCQAQLLGSASINRCSQQNPNNSSAIGWKYRRFQHDNLSRTDISRLWIIYICLLSRFQCCSSPNAYVISNFKFQCWSGWSVQQPTHSISGPFLYANLLRHISILLQVCVGLMSKNLVFVDFRWVQQIWPKIRLRSICPLNRCVSMYLICMILRVCRQHTIWSWR